MQIDCNSRKSIFVLAFLLASLVFPHCAAQMSALTITGRVTDAVTGQPIGRVTIWDQCREVTTKTNATGDYQFVAASTCHGTSTAIALTYSKPGYRLLSRPSFEQRPDDTAAFYTASRTVTVAMAPYKAGYVGEVLRSFAVITPGNSELDAVTFSAGTFQQGDILFVDAVALDSGEDDASFTVTLRGPGLQAVELMTSRSRQGHGGHVQLYGEFSNPSGTSMISGLWHFSFTHSAWPGQSISPDKKLNTNDGQNNWMVGSFTVALRDNTGPAGPNHPHWIEWQVVLLRKSGKR